MTTNTLGGIVLPSQLVWTDRDGWSPVAQTAYRLLSGAGRLVENPLTGLQPVTLTALPDRCWFTRAQVNAIIALAVAPSATHTLVYDGVVRMSAFRREGGAPFEFSPIVGYDDPDDDRYSGEIRLYVL